MRLLSNKYIGSGTNAVFTRTATFLYEFLCDVVAYCSLRKLQHNIDIGRASLLCEFLNVFVD